MLAVTRIEYGDRNANWYLHDQKYPRPHSLMLDVLMYSGLIVHPRDYAAMGFTAWLELVRQFGAGR